VRVAVLAGGRSSEHEVSLNSAASVRRGIADAGHEVLPVTVERAGAWTHAGGALSLTPGGGLLGADAVFPVLHGPFGEDGTIQGLLELLDVPYVGAGVLASSLCMDKIVFKEVLAAAGVPQVESAAVREARWRADPEAVLRELAVLGTPVFVKPARLGSSVGIAKVWSEAGMGEALEGALEHDSLVIVEAFSSGMEVECSVLGNGEPEASVPGEIVLLKGAEWYDYDAKYAEDGMRLQVPARLPETVLEEVRRLAVDTCASTSSSKASACWSMSSTRCRASRTRACSRSCGRRLGSGSRRSATACCSSPSSASRPSAQATRSRPPSPRTAGSRRSPRAPRRRRAW
jgi:D-alanine-D-alanine ligase